jgi:hypothetical protein
MPLERRGKLNNIEWTDQDEYGQVRNLVQSLGGTMEWKPKPPGGSWILKLHGRTREVPVRDHTSLNDLDPLYVAKVPNPASWDDFENTLVPDAFWRLVSLFA